MNEAFLILPELGNLSDSEADPARCILQ